MQTVVENLGVLGVLGFGANYFMGLPENLGGSPIFVFYFIFMNKFFKPYPSLPLPRPPRMHLWTSIDQNIWYYFLTTVLSKRFLSFSYLHRAFPFDRSLLYFSYLQAKNIEHKIQTWKDCTSYMNLKNSNRFTFPSKKEDFFT